MSVSATDCREYFQRRTGVNDSKVNTISLCTAVPYVRDNDKIEYLDLSRVVIGIIKTFQEGKHLIDFLHAMLAYDPNKDEELKKQKKN